MPSMPTPPQLEAARAQLAASLEKVEGKPVDLAKTPWPDLERTVVKVLGGGFSIQKPEHQIVALGLAAALAERLAEAHPVFWFPSRESPEGAELGFGEALMKLSPFGAVVDALSAAKLARLDDVAKEIRNSLAQVKFSGAGGAAQRLGPEDYMRLFDAGFVQLVALDGSKAKQTWATNPPRLSVDVREGLGRANKLPPEVRQQLEQQLLTALNRMDPAQSIMAQAPRAPRIVELMGLLFGATHATGSAPEEFWMDVALPLLFIGAPATFPPLDEDELKVAQQGVDPLFLFLDTVPHQFKAPDEEGLLGAFPAATLALPDPGFQTLSSMRLIKVGTEAVAEPLKQFDPNKTNAIKRFGEHVRAKTGAVPVQAKPRPSKCSKPPSRCSPTSRRSSRAAKTCACGDDRGRGGEQTRAGGASAGGARPTNHFDHLNDPAGATRGQWAFRRSFCAARLGRARGLGAAPCRPETR